MVAVPGATLLSLWQEPAAREALRSSKWDYVVLQDQSQLGDGLRDGKFVVNSPRLLDWGARLFDREIRKAGARTVLLLTWSRREQPEQQADLTYAYDSIAQDLEAILAPAGPAWQRMRSEHPGVNLYDSDGSHPSPAGSYLLGCVLVRSLFPKAAGALPATVAGHPASNDGQVDWTREVPLAALPEQDAAAIQGAAAAAVEEVRRNGATLHAPRPQPRTDAAATTGAPQDLAGAWSGELTFYPSPATLNLTLQFNGSRCEGQVAIDIPARKQRYEAPVFDCALIGGRLGFSVATLPAPFLFDRFEGSAAGARLTGRVERRGRELTNSMSGAWSLGRP